MAMTAFFEILAGEEKADSGHFEWGQTITSEYLPNENEEFFSGEGDTDLVDWLRQYSKEISIAAL